MRVVSKLDDSGLFVADVLPEDGEETPEGCVESRPPEGFYAPKWNGFEWIEGKPPGEILEGLKAAKVDEMAARAIDELAPMFTPGKGRDETALLVAAHVLKICEALKIPPDPRLSEVVATGEKALGLKAEVEVAATVEELEAVTWT